MKRTHLEPLPKAGVLGVLHFVQRALGQTGVQEVSISAKGIEVVREMPEVEEEVVPGGSNDVDVDFLLAHIELLAFPYVPEEHGTAALFGAAQMLSKAGREARWMVAPGWPLVSAWLGIEPELPKTVYGFQLIVVAPARTNGRVVLLGAPAQRMFMSDVTHGVSIDIGV